MDEESICSITWLTRGSETQRRAAECLKRLKIFLVLEEFTPLHASTVANDIDIAGSDLDIICTYDTIENFEGRLSAVFGGFPHFRRVSPPACTDHYCVAFQAGDFEIEVYGSKIPSRLQSGYLHLVATARLLSLHGEVLKGEIRALKMAGHKTEPAIALLFALPGDPYVAVGDLYFRTPRYLSKLSRSKVIQPGTRNAKTA